MRIKDQSIVVTGAAQGIGKCVAEQLASGGARLLLADIQETKVKEVAEELGCVGIGVDVSDPLNAKNMISRSIESYGRIDSLVNVAGIDAPYMDALEVDDDHWRKIIDVNLSGQWWCTSAALAPMAKQGSGRIVIISSIAACTSSEGISPAYAAAKAGLNGLVVSLSSHVEQHGILVNAIAPGHIGSTGTPTPQDQVDQYVRNYPLGFGGPQPVADAVSYLLDDSGNWISGVVMNVSGGFVRGS